MAMVAADKAKKPETGEIGKKPASSASQQPEFTSAASETASKKQTVSKTEFFTGTKDNADLTAQIAILEDASSTEQQKIDALNIIENVVSDSSSGITESQITDLLQAIVDHVLSVSGNDALMQKGLFAIKITCNKNKPIILDSHIDIVLPSIISFAENTAVSEMVRIGAINALGSVMSTGKETLQQSEDVLSTLENISYNQTPSPDVKSAIVGSFLSFFLVPGPVSISDAQIERLFDVIKFLVEQNPSEEIVSLYALNTISTFFSNPYIQKTNGMVKEALDIIDVIMSAPVQPSYQSIVGPLTTLLSHPLLLQNEDIVRITNEFIDLANGQVDFGIQKSIIQSMRAVFKLPDADFDQVFLDSVIDRLQIILDNAGTDDLKATCGGTILQCCFYNTSFFDAPEGALFNISSAIGDAMKANSPDWDVSATVITFGNSNLPLYDYDMIYKIAAAHPEEQIVKTIFETTGITYFGAFTQQQLEHFYFDKDTPIGKPLFFGVLTSHREGVDFMLKFRGSDINDNFDVRFIQPGTTTKLVELLGGTADRLGVQPKDIDPSGLKFKLFAMLAHGMRTSAGYLKEDGPAWDIPEYFNSADTQEITEIGKYFDNARAYFLECSSAGDWQDNDNAYNGIYPYNIAETLGEYAGMKVWGAAWPTNPGLNAVYGMDGADYTVLDVTYTGTGGAIARNSYDYINTSELDMSWSAARSHGQVALNWSAVDLPTTVGYDVERSTDGILFERIGLVTSNGTGAYSYTDASAPATEVFYRIKQRNATPHGTDGSLDYTFAFSEAKTVEASASGISETEAPKLSLEQNYPNPVITSVTNTTTINYTLAEESDITLKVYDLQGREVAVLKDKEKQGTGEQSATLDVSNLAAGVYAYTLTSGSTTLTKKMMIEK